MATTRLIALHAGKDRKGVFAVISAAEDRNKKLREPRPSVLEKIQAPSTKNIPKQSAKNHNKEPIGAGTGATFYEV